MDNLCNGKTITINYHNYNIYDVEVSSIEQCDLNPCWLMISWEFHHYRGP